MFLRALTFAVVMSALAVPAMAAQGDAAKPGSYILLLDKDGLTEVRG